MTPDRAQLVKTPSQMNAIKDYVFVQQTVLLTLHTDSNGLFS